MKNKSKVIKQLDWLLRLKSTGNPNQLSKKLKITKAELYDLIGKMKQLNMPIVFNLKLQSYVYEEPIDLPNNYINQQFF